MVLEGPCTRDTPCGGRERGATGAFGRGVAATPLLHTQNCGMSRDRGVVFFLAKGFCRAKFWAKFPFQRGAVRGEVLHEVFHEVFGLVLVGYSEQKKLQQKLQP